MILRIDRLVPPDEQSNFLAVTQMLARLRYNRDTIETIFRRSGVMIESPWLKEIVEESNSEVQRTAIMEFLTARFNVVPNDMKTELQAVTDPQRLLELIRWAARCPDLEAFRTRLR